ncbi:hypothetical protein [Caballeronia sp. TF1N1]|uniref:hypothetical protein n=1 Tax=Caballeronia sp. TF1N1 TaxID=2878153 RepID=UPI001FD4A31C|nr:hypothetical protein [Caballeronia sp. TF1N1]
MAAGELIVKSDWAPPKLADWVAANPVLKEHSSRLVVDPEVPVSVNPEGNTSVVSAD